MTETDRELLSSHETEAVFNGLVQGRENMLKIYPPRPPKQWAEFRILRYIRYEKPGKYGDPQKDKFRCVASEQPNEIAARIEQLQVGQQVKLSWNHDYVTRVNNGVTSQSPERTITLLENL
mmetsp:Transcript_9145/g.10448  ORF Transcript_9145/g.10448 Transcript_9145/m.10448 type:complete len:121 (-) Transcript_9145:356-718(-)|eukprot:CAMPEP_0184017210 /NCGR_PEP_ID=MMETSP0954-20121128/7393_1 /TAXON_ID=627963 /ORGANISM="Aplanochytrium sp, Strain PBS07" /LENGTH=120 /DNA_ID=CAMNT_0026298387 /DNA_START=117 /DNA_END=479 /DNA_ORIENTATION=+